MKKQKMHARIFLLIGLLSLTTNVFSQDPNFYIYLCFGQSNMEGAGTIEVQDMSTDGADNLHFNSAGYQEFGKRYGTKILSLLGITPTVVQEIKSLGIDGYLLKQNYPNPFNEKTNISFEIPNNTYVSLKVYNMLGTEIIELAGKEYSTGKHIVEFDTKNLAKGIYIYTIKS